LIFFKCRTIRLAAYTQRPKSRETDLIGTYILDLKFAREELKAFNPAAAPMHPFLVHSGHEEIPVHLGRLISKRSRVRQYQWGEAMRPMRKSLSVRIRFFSASNNSSRR
jgi:hypothetical protein